MRFAYWSVRVNPLPLGVTTVGIGVIVQDTLTGQAVCRFRKDKGLLARTNYAEAIKEVQRTLEKMVHALAKGSRSLSLEGTETLESYLGWRTKHWNNFVRVDSMKFADSTDLDSAADMLFDALIGGATHARSGKTVTKAQKQVRMTYQSTTVLSESVIVSPDAQVGGYELGVNLAVVAKSEVYELNEVFSFQTSKPEAAFRRAERWNLKIDKLRTIGGSLQVADQESRVEVDQDVPVVAYYEEPKTLAQSQAFRDMNALWKLAAINPMPVSEAPRRAEHLEAIVA